MVLKEQNILFIVRTMGLGGTENVVLQLCEILLNRVNKIVVCSSGGVHEKKLQEMGIKHYIIADIASKNPIDILKNCKTIKDIIEYERISIIHSHHRMAAFYTELLTSKAMKKVANAHNTFTDKKILTRFAYRNTKVVAVGEMVKKNLIEYFGIPKDLICVIHNAVKPFDGNTTQIEVLYKERIKGNVLIGNIGRLSEQKGMVYFIEAAEITASAHPEARFVIVGDGEEKEQLQKLVEIKGLRDKVLFMGYRNDIQNVMKQLDFVVLSSLWEGLPLTPIEAYSVGKTVIGPSVDGTPEIICDGVDGYLIEPRNPAQLAEKMNKLIENPEIRKNMGIQAMKRYQNEFSFEKLSQRYIAFYEEL